MFLLTKESNDIESGAYATVDSDGTTIVQFFVDKDDAITYNTLLEAIGEDLHVTETKDDNVDKLCDVLGFAYTVVEPGEVVFPRIETLQSDLFNS
jgi:hypothetical protein|tara:strand:+ start:1026 stop:1310 length:285 start_codon:yes stop_codon:yes gene_type:complete